MIHASIGSYGEDPAPILASIRRQRTVDATVRIRAPRPARPEDTFYLQLFEEFRPEFEFSSFSREDVSGQPLLQIPEPYEPVTGAFLQSLCDYSVVSVKKENEEGVCLDDAVPKERRLYTGEEWPESVIQTARSLCTYPEPGYFDAIRRYKWPALRLILFHNSDNSTNQELFCEFLKEHPAVRIWLVNSLQPNERVRCVPLFCKNPVWERIWKQSYIQQPCRKEEREFQILYPGTTVRGEVRTRWAEELQELRDFTPLYAAPFMAYEDALELLEDSVAVVCPPGNGADTHRHWEVLLAGAWMILQNNDHTKRLLEEYPSLPIFPIDDLADLRTLQIPGEGPAPFHPLLLRRFWEILYRSYIL
jgi:hypothetical protein